jgi:hypothetical protein
MTETGRPSSLRRRGQLRHIPPRKERSYGDVCVVLPVARQAILEHCAAGAAETETEAGTPAAAEASPKTSRKGEAPFVSLVKKQLPRVGLRRHRHAPKPRVPLRRNARAVAGC